MPDVQGPALLVIAALVLGLGHGVDWDHIAAIVDLTGTARNSRQAFSRASSYVAGHAAVVLGLGLLAVWAGLTLPEWADDVMQPLVGLTLIALAVWMLFALVRDPQGFRLRSRWMLVADAARAVVRRGPAPANGPDEPAGLRAAMGVGAIHGVGAETPTQVLLFLAAAGAGGPGIGTLVLIAFIAGLVTTNTAVTAASVLGLGVARARRSVYLGFAGTVAAFSLVTGLLFLTGQVNLLPTLIAAGTPTG